MVKENSALDKAAHSIVATSGNKVLLYFPEPCLNYVIFSQTLGREPWCILHMSSF